MKSFLAQITVSSNIDKLMFVFVLYDSKLNQASKATNVEQTVVIQKESPPQKLISLVPSEGKNWLRPHSLLKEGHKQRKKRFSNRMAHNSTDDIKDDFGTDTSDNDTDQNEIKAKMRKMTTLNEILVLAVNLQAKIHKRINVQRSTQTMREGREKESSL